MEQLDKIREMLLCYCKANRHIDVAYLFGSYVKGFAREQSDIDIAVLFEDGLSREQRFSLRLEMLVELEQLYKKKIDMIDLESASLRLIRSIMLDSVIVFTRDTARRVSFEVTKRREYFDIERYFQQHDEVALKRLVEMGVQDGR